MLSPDNFPMADSPMLNLANGLRCPALPWRGFGSQGPMGSSPPSSASSAREPSAVLSSHRCSTWGGTVIDARLEAGPRVEPRCSTPVGGLPGGGAYGEEKTNDEKEDTVVEKKRYYCPSPRRT